MAESVRKGRFRGGSQGCGTPFRAVEVPRAESKFSVPMPTAEIARQ